MPFDPSPDTLMAQDKQQFFKELGARIAQLRKEAGMSHAGRRRCPGAGAADLRQLRGRPSPAAGYRQRGPTPLLQKQIERLNRLPKAQQKAVLKMLEGVLSQPGR